MTRNLKGFDGRMLLVGCGNMAGAMLDRWLKAGLDAAGVAIVDPVAAPREGVPRFASLAEWRAAGGTADWIMLGMKPQQLGEVAGDLADVVTGGTHLLSILAGVSLADLAARFPAAKAQVRILPNLAARIGAGVSAVASSGDADMAAVTALLDPLGTVVALADDSTMDLVTAFTGSGPAFVFRLIESYAAAGERLGLPAEDALKLATATFGGATALLADSGERPGALIAQVASKGGTTQAGLDVLDSDGQLAALLTNVLRAARDRGRELADLARGEG
ncbi:pyrroline-5-carboxylate reductase [Sphingopyxis sp. FD7]|jgi:pyrroline-5-carboxylate reductase|uniref:pyrroline-5-carboxylate reductase n=1 Tax=Sphingopyxis sp. FD7 TaxID=1914525 RepID=UPI000DC62568|nr:pyrroline-5-carboxylate reductase [Sphingopyxis sp. FD7]BBB10941.1 pyrroline-5-carboxylate reductase [Sphingopyxis sp. FD7]